MLAISVDLLIILVVAALLLWAVHLLLRRNRGDTGAGTRSSGKPHPYYGSEQPGIERFAEFAGANARVWVIPEAYHCDGPQRRPDEYADRLVSFFDQAFDLVQR